MSLEEQIFIPARDHLLVKQDERETVIRSCREITSYSKKAIFTLHRSVSDDIVTKELTLYLNVIGEHLRKVNAIYVNNYHLRGSISGAVEELIEFFTFGYYKRTGGLIKYELFTQLLNLVADGEIDAVVSYLLHAETALPEKSLSPIGFVDKSDYIMGLFDCTGEIMRMVISQSSDTSGELQMAKTLENYNFLKDLHEQYTILTTYYPGISIHHGAFDDALNSKGNYSFKKKLQVLESSLSKIQNTLLDILISDKEVL
ncbi:hypothetical protein CANMA_000685 [Candida margitis]|uniref:uncharacterized protein n=1 Tax=Candida margitis TaxID=1775924 RepID=UPI002225E730|nr:uncharacterized protein CANMA_000685 [Candida margitis]KAI5970332.1 hypothetical protein CANMA_000685 [Candida margitis]